MKIPFEGILGIYTFIAVCTAIAIVTITLKVRSDRAEKQQAAAGKK